MSVKTVEDTHDHKVIQFSVFLENKAGKLLDIVSLFGQYNIHVVALTILDTVDCSVARLVVDNPDLARSLFQEHTYAFCEANLVVVELPSSASDLRNVLKALLQAEVNIHFTYSFLTRPRGKAALAMCVEDEDCATKVLHQNHFKVLTQKDITR
ncbi:MAG: acetolactate synthase [Verrucomicrobiota bacterium]